ncbi:hypothetical protein DICVIV_04518 [Dictyocaulus viviparus]|uniref:Uncharacterized protein n=1 Tax=Dictyocaulus viviparus TaxID=29172 RepID=A0A0D8XXK1_DICVI|nr:hypothetical protein DICVIV_04518 [Dictyocaulus viviparus]
MTAFHFRNSTSAHRRPQLRQFLLTDRKQIGCSDVRQIVISLEGDIDEFALKTSNHDSASVHLFDIDFFLVSFIVKWRRKRNRSFALYHNRGKYLKCPHLRIYICGYIFLSSEEDEYLLKCNALYSIMNTVLQSDVY